MQYNNHSQNQNHYQNIHEQETPQHDKLCTWFSKAFYEWKNENFPNEDKIQLMMEFPITNGYGNPVRYVDFVVKIADQVVAIVEIKPSVNSMGTTVRQMNEYKARLSANVLQLLVTYQIEKDHYDAIRNQGISVLIVNENDERLWLFDENQIENYNEYNSAIAEYEKNLNEFHKEKEWLKNKVANHESQFKTMENKQKKRDEIAGKMPKNLTLLKGLNDLMIKGHKKMKESEYQNTKKKFDSLSPPTKPSVDDIPYYCFFSMIYNVDAIKEKLRELKRS